MIYPFSKVMVTGGCGFIGSHFIEQLSILHPQVSILNLDSCTYAVSKNTIEMLNTLKNYSLIRADIRNANAVNSAIESFKPEIIIHFAAESHVDNSIKDPNIFLESNILGTANMLNAINNLQLQDHVLFHHISTDEVFGDMKLDSANKFEENSPINPSSPYAASKASSDMLVKAWSRTYGIRYIITNCGNNYGPRQNSEKLIPTVIKCLLENKKIPVYGSGKNIRDWIYVTDHAKILIELHKSKAINDEFNIGLSNELSNLELIKQIYDYLSKSIDLNDFNETVNFIEDRKGHDLRYALNSKKLMKIIEYKNNRTFSECIGETINWYISNMKW